MDAAGTVVLQAGRKTCPMKAVEDFFSQLYGSSYHIQKTQAKINSTSPIWEYNFGELTSVASLALHRFGRRVGEKFPLSLHELLPQYQRNECTEPCDHVYALYNLSGDHRKHLSIDYAQSRATRIHRVLDFLHKYDRMPSA